jgi:hypothetical protein
MNRIFWGALLNIQPYRHKREVIWEPTENCSAVQAEVPRAVRDRLAHSSIDKPTMYTCYNPFSISKQQTVQQLMWNEPVCCMQPSHSNGVHVRILVHTYKLWDNSCVNFRMLKSHKNNRKKLAMHKTDRVITELTERTEVLWEENWMKLVLDLNIPLQNHSHPLQWKQGIQNRRHKSKFPISQEGFQPVNNYLLWRCRNVYISSTRCKQGYISLAMCANQVWWPRYESERVWTGLRRVEYGTSVRTVERSEVPCKRTQSNSSFWSTSA